MTVPISVVITSRRDLTPLITEFTLARTDSTPLPSAEPGAHIGVQTPSGAFRQYSLVSPSEAPDSYTIAVKHEATGRGGSASVHAQWAVGTNTVILPPKNDFPLTNAPGYLLIAGGIGVTPIYSMAQSLLAKGAKVRMIYCTRSRSDTAYIEELTALLGENLILHHDEGDVAKVYDFWDEFAEPRTDHVFCCGPQPLMEEIKSISGHWSEGRVHFEDFAGVQAVYEDDKAFDVVLKKSDRTITVAADQTILEALREAGVPTVSSCESGTCGTCKCTLLDGDVSHRDMVLMDEEKADKIMICVSRANSGGLVLDL